MVDKYSAPAFTMGSKSRIQKNNLLPGPGAYDTLSYLKQAHKSYKVGSQKRFSQYATQVPGPGSYQKLTRQEHIPTASILSKSKQHKVENVPGPGSYNPDYKKTIKANGCYKVGLADKLGDQSKYKKQLPGPGQYETATNTLISLHNATKFGSQKRSQLINKKLTPGPGQYSQLAYYNGSVSNNPKISFSKSNRSNSLSLLTPGPGNYTLKSNFQESVQKKKGFSLKFRTNSDVGQHTFPGPGTYNNQSLSATKKGGPSFSMSKSPKLKIDNQKQILSKPTPFSYNSTISAIQKGGITIPHETRKGFQNKAIVPGPGSYQPKFQSTQKLYSIPKSSTFHKDKSSELPGPGTYDPKVQFPSQYQNIGVGKDKRKPFYDQKQGIPGPGQYKYEQKKVGGFTIGHEKRGQNKTKGGPGPGNYNVPSTLSNLPKYSQSGK